MKHISKIMSILLIAIVFGQTIAASSTSPSFWAVDEVNEAIENRLVTDELMGNYQTPIKRYEYVVLALELLKRNGDHIKIVEKYPFNDIEGHEFEEEIVTAYNAGIIKGLGDGSFNPDANITRAEIASLIVNLTLRLDPDRDVYIPEEYEFHDLGAIRDWALPYINYCYENGIIKGIGDSGSEQVVIGPLGEATIEQSIVMLYRLATNEGVLEKFNIGTIEIHQLTENGIEIQESKIINEFAQTVGEGLAFKIKILSSQGLVVNSMTSEHAELQLEKGMRVSIDYNHGVVEIKAKTGVLGNTDLDDLIFLFEAYGFSEEVSLILDSSIQDFDTNDDFRQTTQLDEKNNLTLTQEIEVVEDIEYETYWYVFKHTAIE